MGLIPSHRHSPADLAHWAMLERYDTTIAKSPRLARLAEQAVRDMSDFAEAGACHIGVSWGKDSVVVAALAALAGLPIPLVWVRVEPNENPDCAAVRDAFLARFTSVEYHELVSYSEWCDESRSWDGKMLKGKRFRPAEEAFGPRYISGVRSEESNTRAMREAVWGVSSANTCAPITRWTAIDVFAFLRLHDLPVHPAYACSHGGALDRRWLRVAYLGGARGRGAGREEWERSYYRDEMDALGCMKP
jgi:phosphoadenosine phosphosulfate reductase